jgi:UrcA family protein
MNDLAHTRKGPLPALRLALGLAVAGAAFAATPAAAQTYDNRAVDELTVVGRYGPDGPARLSRSVDISDLNLRYDADVREMQIRVRHTARQLCEELGETGGPGVTPSCVDAAVRGAQRQARIAVALARSPEYYAYNAPAPYPSGYVPPYVGGEYAPPASAVVPYDEPPL